MVCKVTDEFHDEFDMDHMISTIFTYLHITTIDDANMNKHDHVDGTW